MYPTSLVLAAVSCLRDAVVCRASNNLTRSWYGSAVEALVESGHRPENGFGDPDVAWTRVVERECSVGFTTREIGDVGVQTHTDLSLEADHDENNVWQRIRDQRRRDNTVLEQTSHAERECELPTAHQPFVHSQRETNTEGMSKCTIS